MGKKEYNRVECFHPGIDKEIDSTSFLETDI